MFSIRPVALGTLRDEARQATPPQATPDDDQLLRFLVKHADDKVRRALDNDPAAALFAMHLGLAELLDIDRRLHGRWEVSSKRLLADLRLTDPQVAGLIEDFVGIGALDKKFAAWEALVAHIARPATGLDQGGEPLRLCRLPARSWRRCGNADYLPDQRAALA